MVGNLERLRRLGEGDDVVLHVWRSIDWTPNAIAAGVDEDIASSAG